MSKLAIGAYVEKVPGDRRSAAAVAAFAAVDGSVTCAVDTDGRGACRFFTGAKPAFTVDERGAT